MFSTFLILIFVKVFFTEQSEYMSYTSEGCLFLLWEALYHLVQVDKGTLVLGKRDHAASGLFIQRAVEW